MKIQDKITLELAGYEIKLGWIEAGGLAAVLLMTFAIIFRSLPSQPTSSSLPDAANSRIMSDMKSVSNQAAESVQQETFPQTAETDTTLTNRALIQENLEQVGIRNQELITTSQLVIAVYMYEEAMLVKGRIEAERSNPTNPHCYQRIATNLAECGKSILDNRMTSREEAEDTATRDDDLFVALENVSFALALQMLEQEETGSAEINSPAAPTLSYFNNMVVDSNGNRIAFDETVSLLGASQINLNTTLEELAKARSNQTTSIIDRSKADCLNGVVTKARLEQCQ